MKENADLTNLRPIIQTSIGASIIPKSRQMIDLSVESVEYTLMSEDGKSIEKWEISAVYEKNDD